MRWALAQWIQDHHAHYSRDRNSRERQQRIGDRITSWWLLFVKSVVEVANNERKDRRRIVIGCCKARHIVLSILIRDKYD